MLVGGLLSALAASAQEELLPERLYVGSNLLVGSARMVALGGAEVAIAEGAAALSDNLAALAHRSPKQRREWDVDIALSYVGFRFGNTQNLDLDNDGTRDESQESRQWLAGMKLQFHNVGVGGFTRLGTSAFCLTLACGAGDVVRVELATHAMAAAVALWEDQLIVAAGLYVLVGSFRHQATERGYGANGFTGSALVRPRRAPYRVGISFEPPVVAPYDAAVPGPASMAGRRLYAALTSPTQLSVGVSWRLGEGAHRYNMLSPAAEAQWGVHEHSNADGPPGQWLLSAQLEVIGGVSRAVPLSAFTTLREPRPVGERIALVPHVGVEHETIPGRVRLRAGAMLEPSLFRDTAGRPHLTGGAQLFLFHKLDDWALTLSFDLARGYNDFGLAFGVWR